jgi:hypothetical protein
MRRTVKINIMSKELKKADVDLFSKLVGGRLFYFPKEGEHAKYMENEAVNNFKFQMENKRAMEEMALWTRLKNTEAKKFRDGLTVDGMEISGFLGWYVRSCHRQFRCCRKAV